MPQRVRVTDVSPRDGLQNEAGVISTVDKARLVQLLCKSGVDEIEVTSFVSPRWVPQLGDSAALFDTLHSAALPGQRPMFSALVPNEQGMSQAQEVAQVQGLLQKVSVFTAASETFAQKNTNASIAQTLERFRPVIDRARNQCVPRLFVRGYISCVIACPFEGPVAPATVADIAARFVHLGVDEIDLGDTIGAGTPESVAAVLHAVKRTLGTDWWSADRMTLHLHDTFGLASECVKAALDLGVRSFDGSVGGLGGCPYASRPGKPAPGNIATELLVRTVEQCGYSTGIRHAELNEAAGFARQIVSQARKGGA